MCQLEYRRERLTFRLALRCELFGGVAKAPSLAQVQAVGQSRPRLRVFWELTQPLALTNLRYRRAGAEGRASRSDAIVTMLVADGLTLC